MNDFNKVILMGRLGKDPELTNVNGKALCKFSIAVSDGKGDKQHTNWFNIVCWDGCAESCGKFLTKGRQVLVEGRLKVRNYEQDGVKKYITEVIAKEVNFIGSSKPKEDNNELDNAFDNAQE